MSWLGAPGGEGRWVQSTLVAFQSRLRFVAPCLPHPLSVGDKQPTILKWRILSATNDLDRVSAVALPKLPISLTNTDLKVASDTQFYPGLGTVFQGSWGSEGGVHCGLGLQSQGHGNLAQPYVSPSGDEDTALDIQ